MDEDGLDLSLDLATIQAINRKLKLMVRSGEFASLDSVHGSISLKIVKGQFQLVSMTCEELLITKQAKRRSA